MNPLLLYFFLQTPVFCFFLPIVLNIMKLIKHTRSSLLPNSHQSAVISRNAGHHTWIDVEFFNKKLFFWRAKIISTKINLKKKLVTKQNIEEVCITTGFTNPIKNCFLKQENKKQNTFPQKKNQRLQAQGPGSTWCKPSPITSTRWTTSDWCFVGTIFLFTAPWQT